MKKTVVFVNGDKFDLEDEQISVGELIKLGGGNIQEYDLQERHGNNGPVVKTFKDPNEVITVQNGTHFITHFLGTVNPA